MVGIRQTKPWDVVDEPRSDADIAAYLNAAMEDGGAQMMTAALGDVVRARGVSQVARDAGLAREGLYRSLSVGGNPEFWTVLKVLSALGLRFSVETRAAGEHAS